jgi:hypothetical protein
MIRYQSFVRAAALAVMVSALGLQGCAEEKKKGGGAKAPSGQSCSQCKKDKGKLTERLKKAETQIKKLKKELAAARGKAPVSSAEPAASAKPMGSAGAPAKPEVK